MIIRVDPNICAGFGVCVGLCPEVFELHEDGYAFVRVTEPPPEFESEVRAAVNQCPARAISIVEDSTP